MRPLSQLSYTGANGMDEARSNVVFARGFEPLTPSPPDSCADQAAPREVDVLVPLPGLEPGTSSLPWKRSTSGAPAARVARDADAPRLNGLPYFHGSPRVASGRGLRLLKDHVACQGLDSR